MHGGKLLVKIAKTCLQSCSALAMDRLKSSTLFATSVGKLAICAAHDIGAFASKPRWDLILSLGIEIRGIPRVLSPSIFAASRYSAALMNARYTVTAI